METRRRLAGQLLLEGRTIGEVMESGELQAHVLGIMGECAALAVGQGIVLPGAIVEDSFEKGRNFPYETKTSFQRDFEQANRPDERDLFGGTLLRLGRSLGLDIPVTRLIYEKLQAMKPVGASPE